MFGFGNHNNHGLQVFEQDGKYGVGKTKQFVPFYGFATKAEAEEYIKEHGAEVASENGE